MCLSSNNCSRITYTNNIFVAFFSQILSHYNRFTLKLFRIRTITTIDNLSTIMSMSCGRIALGNAIFIHYSTEHYQAEIRGSSKAGLFIHKTSSQSATINGPNRGIINRRVINSHQVNDWWTGKLPFWDGFDICRVGFINGVICFKYEVTV